MSETRSFTTAVKTTAADWKAWINMMPGSVPTLHVVGEIDVGNASDGATIVFDSEEKSNPPILVLKVVYQTILVPRPAGDTRVALHYTRDAKPGQFAGITVLCPGGNTIDISRISIAN